MTLEAKRDQSEGSLPYMGTEALGCKSPNWSVVRSPMTQGVLRHKESYDTRSLMALGVLIKKDS